MKRSGARAVVAARALGVAMFALGASTQLHACNSGPFCPVGWTEPETVAPCIPPQSTIDDVASRIGTGIHGYALDCTRVSDGDDVCTCEVDGIASEGTIAVFRREQSGSVTENVFDRSATIASDGTFALQLEPGVVYLIEVGGASGPEGTYYPPSFTVEVVLEPGEVRLLVGTHIITC